MDTEDGSELTDLFGASYQSPLSLIDPSDIESIDVLKDAASRFDIWIAGYQWCHSYYHQERTHGSYQFLGEYVEWHQPGTL